MLLFHQKSQVNPPTNILPCLQLAKVRLPMCPSLGHPVRGAGSGDTEMSVVLTGWDANPFAGSRNQSVNASANRVTEIKVLPITQASSGSNSSTARRRLTTEDSGSVSGLATPVQIWIPLR